MNEKEHFGLRMPKSDTAWLHQKGVSAAHTSAGRDMEHPVPPPLRGQGAAWLMARAV